VVASAVLSASAKHDVPTSNVSPSTSYLVGCTSVWGENHLDQLIKFTQGADIQNKRC